MSSYTLNNSNISGKTDLDCGWLILVEPSYVVQMQVVTYTETPKCSSNETNCVCSSVQVTIILIIEFKMYCLLNIKYISTQHITEYNIMFIKYFYFYYTIQNFRF